MKTWNQHDIHNHMVVYSADNQKLGHITGINEDAFSLHKGLLFAKDKYIPYSEITNIENEQIHLRLNAKELQDPHWDQQHSYEEHLGDPTQLMYDRSHGEHDPFDKDEA